jgi:hypothetical protein
MLHSPSYRYLIAQLDTTPAPDTTAATSFSWNCWYFSLMRGAKMSERDTMLGTGGWEWR